MEQETTRTDAHSGLLTVIVPALNEEENIPLIADRIADVLGGADIPYEVLFVDDGSRDGTFARIREAAAKNECVRGVSFARNFGKEAAIFAGFAEARGRCCAVIDSDMQQPPETLVEMYRAWQGGCDIVEGVKRSRGDEKTAGGLFARLFYRILGRLTGFDMQNASDYKLLDRSVVEILRSLPERNTFFRGLTFWTGFPMARVEYDVAPRLHGKSKWSFGKLVRYALANITNFSSAPLNIITATGAVFCIFAVVLGVQSLVRYFSHNSVEGFTTVILLQLLSIGAVLLSLGLIGHYVAKIYEEVKGRPRYVIHKSTEKDGDGTR